MPLSPSLITYLEHFKKPARRFKVEIAYSAVRSPVTFDLTDGDVGKGHIVDASAVTIPRLGPDRYCKKGETVRFYAGDSYVRGGGGATIEGWTAYYLGAAGEDPPVDSAYGGTEVPSAIVSPAPDGGGNPATAAFTPTQAGHWRIEMHAVGMLLNGDGIVAPYPNACRFVRVFDTDIDGSQIEWDGEGIATIAVNGSIENGGATATLTIRRKTRVGYIDPIYPVENQRVILGVKTFFRTPQVDTWTEYTWNPGHGDTDYIWYTPNIFFEGYVRGDGVVEDAFTGDVTVQLVGVRGIVDQIAFPTTVKDIPDEETGEPTGLKDTVPTAFIDSASYDAIMSEAADAEQFLWVHRIEGMTYSDVYLHLLSRHSDFCTFNDAAVWQYDDPVPFIELREGNLFGFIKTLEAERLGVVFGDLKGVLYAGPDVDLRGDAYWATVTDPDFVADGDTYKEIHIQEQPASVGQVVLRSVDQRDLLPAAFRGDVGDDMLQTIIRKQYEAKWPEERGSGQRFELFGVPVFDRSALATLARKFHRKLNKQFPSIQIGFQMLNGIDLMQNVAVTFTPRTGLHPLSGLLAHVTGLQMSINVGGMSWNTTLTCAETVDAAAVQVPDIGPTARIQATAFREVLADGTEKRFILLQSRSKGGDEPIVEYQWQSDGGGGNKTGRRAVYAYDEAVASVTIMHTVVDANGLTDTATKIVDLANLPASAATFGETLWVASAAGSHVSPDGGETWLESDTPGDATAVWATDDSNFGFFGNSAGQVFLTRDLGATFTQASGTPNSAVVAMWGDPRIPSAIVGYANGMLWEVAWSKQRSVLQATEIKQYRYQGGTGAVTFVHVADGMIFVGAGDYMYAGTRSDWRRIARFPGQILRGAARASLAADASAGDNAYTFVISLVFAAGGQNWQEQGRVRVGGRGVEWFTESIVPIPSGAGADTAVGALDQAAPILLSFDAANVPYLLPSAGHEAPGPAIIPATAIPAVTSIKAVEYGYGGRDHAFLGHSTGVYKNFDPNREGQVIGGNYVPAPSNLWLPFHGTGAQVRDLYVTRPKEPPVTYRGLVYILMPAGTARTDMVVWSPLSDPPSYEHVESYFKDETGNNVLPTPNIGSGYSYIQRWRSIGNRRLTDKTVVDLPPGFRSLSQFVLINTDAGSVETRGLYHPRIPAALSATRFVIDDQGIDDGIVTGGTMSGVGGTNKIVNDAVVGSVVQGNGRGGGAAGIQRVWTFSHYPTGQSDIVPLLNGDARFANHYYARRDHDPQPGIRGAALRASTSGPAYGAKMMRWLIDDNGFVLPGIIETEMFAGNTINTPSFLSNEYIQIDSGGFPPGLYYLPWGEESGAEAATGINNPMGLVAESFDVHWLIDDAGTVDWRLLYRDPTDPLVYTHLPFPTDLVSFLDDWAGSDDWMVLESITATGLTEECVVCVFNGAANAESYRYRLISIRRDGSWDDVSGNLWESSPGAGDGLYGATTRPYALRHVLPTEFDPIQYADAVLPEPITIPPWSPPTEAPSVATPYPVAVLADTPWLYYRMGDHPYYNQAYDSSGGARHIAYEVADAPDAPYVYDFEQTAGLIAGDADKATLFRQGTLNVGQFFAGYTGDWSVEMVVKRSADETAGDHYLFAHGGDSTTIISLIVDHAANKIYFWNGNSGADVATGLALDTTYHIAATWEAATGELTFYVDGVETYQDVVGTGRHLGTHDTYLLSYYDGISWGFQGVADEIALYKSVLGADRVAAHAALVQ